MKTAKTGAIAGAGAGVLAGTVTAGGIALVEGAAILATGPVGLTVAGLVGAGAIVGSTVGAFEEKNEAVNKAVNEAANERKERAKLEKKARKAQEEAEKEARIKDEKIQLLRQKLNNEPYTAHLMPNYLAKHISEHQGAINFQVIAGTSKGKSTMVKHILDRMEVDHSERPTIGTSETTMEPYPYKIKDKLFIWDMPGLGGLNISNKKQWNDFLIEYGTGHFDQTFLICDAKEGINQMELFFLRHLLHNKRSVTLVVSNTDSLMINELVEVKTGQSTRQRFYQKFESHQQEFCSILDTKVRELLPKPLPKKDIIFISKPENDTLFNGYKAILDHFRA